MTVPSVRSGPISEGNAGPESLKPPITNRNYMNIKPGIKLLDESEGEGKTAEKGDKVVYSV